jgi:hypothetical protein
LRQTLRAALNQCGAPLRELEKLTGINRGVLWRFGQGQRDIKLDTASKLCDVLGLELVSTGEGVRR